MEQQKEIIEKKRLEIAEKSKRKAQLKIMAENLKTQSVDPDKSNDANNQQPIFKNDGSFLEQFKILKEMAEKAKNSESPTLSCEQTNRVVDSTVRYKLIWKIQEMTSWNCKK